MKKMINNKKNNLMVIVFSSYVAVIPILQYYKSPISLFNLATFLGILFGIIFLISSIQKNKIPKLHFAFIFYICFLSINVIYVAYITRIKLSLDYLDVYFRMLILILSILWLGSSFFNYKIAFKTLRIVLSISAILMVFQLFFHHIFGIQITEKIPALLTSPSYGIVGGRPEGLYMEPAHYAQSAILYLCWALFGENKNSKINWKYIIIITTGIIISGSGQGYLFIILLYVTWYFMSLRKSKKQIVMSILFVIIFFISLTMLSNLGIVQMALERVIYENGKLGGQALDGRTWSNKYFLNLPDAQKWYGIGFGQKSQYTSAYMNGVYELLFQCGYPAFAVIFILLFSGLKQKERYKRIYTLLYAILINFAAFLSPMMLCFVFSFLLSKGSIELEGENKGQRYDYIKFRL